jgi:hypothetical protein
VSVYGDYDAAAGVVELRIENPFETAMPGAMGRRAGHQIALENLKQRFELAWGARASVRAGAEAGRYCVKLRFPVELEP